MFYLSRRSFFSVPDLVGESGTRGLGVRFAAELEKHEQNSGFLHAFFSLLSSGRQAGSGS